MSIQDSLYNWLTIKVVLDIRPNDQAALDTYQLFKDILKKDHDVTDIKIEKDDEMYYLHYDQHGEEKKTRFPIELIDIMKDQIQQEPEKYPIFKTTY